MSVRSRLRAFVRRIRRPASWERELHEELHAYLDHEIDARIEAGMSPAEARRTAYRDLGGVDQVKEHVRSGATGAWLDMLGQDVRYAYRALRHSRAFTAWVVGSLAIGMAVAIAALALLNAALFKPFPAIGRQDRLVKVEMTLACGQPDCWSRMSSPADFAALQDGLTALGSLAAYTQGDIAVALPAARSMRSVFTSANYFDVLGVRPGVGRLFTAGDAESRSAVAVISHGVWIREFAADPSAVGRSIHVADEIVQIVGVAPEPFVGVDLKLGGRGPDIWLPMWLTDRVLPLTISEQRRQERYVDFVGRMKDRVDLMQVQAEADVAARQLGASRGRGSQPVRADVRPVGKQDPHRAALTVMLLLPIPILVLAIACVNAANLMLARGSQRQREIAVRLAIGASRGRIIRQLLIESAVLTVCATALALPIAWWSLQLARTPLVVPIPLDATVLALTILTAAATSLAFGLMPAIRATASPSPGTLGPGRAGGDATPRQSRVRRLLLVAQVALSLALLATGWQLVATVRSQAGSGGTPPDRLLMARFDLQKLSLGPDESARFYQRLVTAASRLPGVEAAGLARPTSVWTFGQGKGPGSVVVWRPADGPADGRVTIGGYAGGSLFEAVGLRAIEGRGFLESDRQARPQVAVVNQTFARAMAGPVLGGLLRVAPRSGDFGSAVEVRIVGIIESAQEPAYTGDGLPVAKVYLPSPIEPEPALALYLRTRGAAALIAPPVRELVGEIAPRVPIQEIGSLDDFNERSSGPQLWLARAAAALGVIGLLLASAGLYGVSSYLLSLRSREIAIRMALGARPSAILSMTLGQSMRVAAVGLVAGGAIAVLAGGLIRAQFHGVRGIDGLALGGAAALFVAAMLVASAVPAVRASRLDPVETLKDG